MFERSLFFSFILIHCLEISFDKYEKKDTCVCINGWMNMYHHTPVELHWYL